MYQTLYNCSGRTRSYIFSIDACTPPRVMLKRELAQTYYPDASDAKQALNRLAFALSHARQPQGTLSDNDAAIARADGNVYLEDVLHDIAPIGTAKLLHPAHVAAILHFLGPVPDREDVLALAA
jgi:hypothetical protein